MINRLIVLGEQSVVTIVACKRGFKCGWGCRSVARSVLFARRADATRFARSQPITFPSRGASQPGVSRRKFSTRTLLSVLLSLSHLDDDRRRFLPERRREERLLPYVRNVRKRRTTFRFCRRLLSRASTSFGMLNMGGGGKAGELGFGFFFGSSVLRFVTFVRLLVFTGVQAVRYVFR